MARRFYLMPKANMGYMMTCGTSPRSKSRKKDAWSNKKLMSEKCSKNNRMISLLNSASRRISPGVPPPITESGVVYTEPENTAENALGRL